jgi:Tfp pilus assembly protein PilN
MSQQINLYEAPPVRNLWKDYFPFAQIGLVLSGIIIVIAIFFIGQKISLNDQLADTQVLVQASKLELDQLNQKRGGQDLKSSFEKDIADLELKMKEKQAFLLVMGAEDRPNVAGFSRHLEGLARQSEEGLWLTRIELFKGGRSMGLEGLTSEPEYVPRLIKKLGNETAFTGAEFDIFKLQQQDDLLSFIVSATREVK